MTEKTTKRDNRYGAVTLKVSLWEFPRDIHQRAKDRVSSGYRIYDIYSEAVSNLKRDYDSGEPITLLEPPINNEKTQIWLLKPAYDDMIRLEHAMHGNHTSIVFTALTRFLEKDRGAM